MKYIFLIPFLFYYSCSKTSNKCVEHAVLELKAQTDFNYYTFLSEFENYNIKQEFLEDTSLKSWIEFHKNKQYCNIDYENFILSVDNTYATSPEIGESFINCPNFKIKNIDSLSYNTSEYTLSLLKTITEEEFEHEESKILILYLTSLLMSNCNINSISK